MSSWKYFRQQCQVLAALAKAKPEDPNNKVLMATVERIERDMAKIGPRQKMNSRKPRFSYPLAVLLFCVLLSVTGDFIQKLDAKVQTVALLLEREVGE